jgi:hypothetical protein
MTGQDDTRQEGHERHAMNDWEAQINAMLDGELDDSQAEALKSAAERDQKLARAIIEAYELQRLTASLPREEAPASLRRKLLAIPAEQTVDRKAASAAARRGPQPHEARDRHGWLEWLRQPQWVAAAAAVPLALLLVLTISGPDRGQRPPPTQAEISQARQDLALALAYLERAGRATERRIDSHFDRRIAAPVTEEMVRAIEEPFDLGGNGQGESQQIQSYERQEREA